MIPSPAVSLLRLFANREPVEAERDKGGGGGPDQGELGAEKEEDEVEPGRAGCE